MENFIAIFISLIIFGVIVVVHEFGHFIAAKKNGVCVEEFAIGMGPKLFGIQKGETLYSIRLFPIGGFCKMLGEDESNTDARSFNNKKVSQRIVIILAGVFMNFLLAFVLQMIVSSISFSTISTISGVSPGYPAEAIGIEKGDTIIKYNGQKVVVFEDLLIALSDSGNSETEISFKKPNGEIISSMITPKKNEEGNYIIGVMSTQKAGFFADKVGYSGEYKEAISKMEKFTFFEYLKYSYDKVMFNIRYVVFSLKKIVSLQVSSKDVSGPIGMVTMIGNTYTETMEKRGPLITFIRLADFTILLSANLGVMNMLPLPAIDGGRFVFLILEALRGKPVNPEKEGIVHLVGFALLMLLAVFIAYNDIVNLIAK